MGRTPERSAVAALPSPNRYQVTRWILDAALVGLILIALAAAILGRLVPMTGRETLLIGGASMEPEIQLGAAIVIEPVAPEQIAVGDIVSLRSGEGLKSIFTHRVTRVIHRSDGIWIETKGDANRILDASITPAANVMGRVVLNVPYGGYLLKLLSMPSGVALMICLAGLLVTGIWLVETLEYDRRRTPVRDADTVPPLDGVPAPSPALPPARPRVRAARRRPQEARVAATAGDRST